MINHAAIFPDEDYRFAMKFEREPPADFFAPTPAHSRVLAERRKWLHTSAGDYVALDSEGTPLVIETLGLFRDWSQNRYSVPTSEDPSLTTWTDLGRAVEADLLLLEASPDGAFRLRAGCVCFPSSWSLAEKMGHTVEEIHGIVPGLNAALARPISGFLSKMAPGIAWRRANWGLSRSAELNLHPHRKLPRLDDTIGHGDVWLRIEHQALVALPRTRGILFGIRVEVLPLSEVLRDAAAAAGLHRALRTMPGAVAIYKGIAPALPRLLTLVG